MNRRKLSCDTGIGYLFTVARDALTQHTLTLHPKKTFAELVFICNQNFAAIAMSEEIQIANNTEDSEGRESEHAVHFRYSECNNRSEDRLDDDTDHMNKNKKKAVECQIT